VLHRKDGLPSVYFEGRDLAMLQSATARLNDVCINGGAALLREHFTRRYDTGDYAILTTFDLLRARYRASDDDLWRNIHKTQYWRRHTWVLPIHRRSTEHWVVCIITIEDRRLLLFDSLAAEHPWQQDVPVCLSVPLRASHRRTIL